MLVWSPALPGHHAARPMRAVTLGVKNSAMTNAAMMMPNEMANPISVINRLPASIIEANVPARIAPADAIVGPENRIAARAACRGSSPRIASSRRRATIRML